MFLGVKFKTRYGATVKVIGFDENFGLYMYWDKYEGVLYERLSYILCNKIEEDKID